MLLLVAIWQIHNREQPEFFNNQETLKVNQINLKN